MLPNPFESLISSTTPSPPLKFHFPLPEANTDTPSLRLALKIHSGRFDETIFIEHLPEIRRYRQRNETKSGKIAQSHLGDARKNGRFPVDAESKGRARGEVGLDGRSASSIASNDRLRRP